VTVMFAPKVALIGKGKSLESYKGSCYQDVCINETVYLVPDPYACIAIDYKVLDKYTKVPPPCIIMKKRQHKKYSFPNEELWDYTLCPHGKHATAPIAIQVLQHYGVKEILFVGFDAIDGDPDYCDGVIKNEYQGTNRDGYKRISSETLRILDCTGVEAEWFHRSL